MSRMAEWQIVYEMGNCYEILFSHEFSSFFYIKIRENPKWKNKKSKLYVMQYGSSNFKTYVKKDWKKSTNIVRSFLGL